MALLAACQPQPSTETAQSDEAWTDGEVARFGEFRLDRETLDRFIIDRLARERPVPGTDLDAWYREQISEYMIEAQLLRQAREAGLDRSADFVEALKSARAQIETELCVRHQTHQLPPIPRTDLEAEFERNREQFNKPERRLTLHLYRRAADETARAVASAELEGLRDRVLQGEDFARLARAHSDSESRHRGGELGWLFRGDLPDAIDRVVFELDEGVPSRPLSTSDGVHLLLVQSVSPAREASLIEVMPILRERILLRQVDSIVRPIIENDTRDFGMPDAARLAALLQRGDDHELLLHAGEYRLDVGTFRRHLAQLNERRTTQGETAVSHPWQVLQATRAREKLRSACVREGWIEEAQLSQALVRWEREQLISLQRREILRALAAADEDRLRLYHSQNPDQFSTPVRWTLRRLRVALDVGASATMAALEDAARDGQIDLESLQATLGGELDTLAAQRLPELRRIAPSLPALVAPLQPGQLSAPMRTLEHLEIYQLISLDEPEPASFESARERVITNFVRQHAAALYRRHVEQTFAQQALQIDPVALEQLLAAELPQPDISADRLAQLLEAL